MSQEQGEIRICGVSKIFNAGQASAVTALQDVHLSVAPGELVALVGPSGCGKSTLLRLVAGLETPTAGELFLDGQPIAGAHFERGLVFQDPNLFPWLTIFGNVAAGLKARGVFRKEDNEVAAYIKLVGLEGFEKHYPYQLSGGMAQRASLARSFVNHPKVLLLDEPFGALDAFTRMNMQEELLRIWRDEKNSILLVTHDVDEAIYLASRIVIMTPRPGKIEGILEVQLDRRHARNDDGFLKLRAKVLELLHFAEKPIEPGYYL